MDTISEALRNLYVAFGGNADDVKNLSVISEIINAIATQAATLTAAAASTELPSVTASDNGKVLKVANGKWAVGTDETSST